ncbi:MAG: hypothetical protein ACYC2O_00455 [Microthrixaceae bacterium]
MSTSPAVRPTGQRRVRQVAVACVAALLAMVLPAVAPSAAAPPSGDPATAGGYAAGWLARELDKGIPMVNFGSPDWGVTLDAALSLAATASGASQLDAVWSALVADREAVADPFGAGDAPGRIARVILLAHALGEDPTAVGAGPGADMVARLLATETPAGPDAGLFGDPASVSPTYDGAFRQGYSVAALVAVGAPVPTDAVQWLIDQQCPDGSWMPYRGETAPGSGVLVPCAFDGVLFTGPDSNSTAAAVNGLVAAGLGATQIDDAAGWMATVQNADGGWGSFPGDPSEPSSTALVWQSLVGAGLGSDPVFLSGSATPLATLLSFQLGCTSPVEDRGALTYPGSNDAPNAFSTAQATPALAGVQPEFGPVTPADVAPVVDCSVPTTTTPPPDTATAAGSGGAPAATTTTTISSGRPVSVAAESAARPISFVG